VANALYDTGRNTALGAGLGWTTNTISMILATSGYTVNLATDQFLTALSTNTVGSKVALSGKSASAGIATCSAVTFTAVPTGSTVIAFVFFIDTGTAGTSQLIGYIDTLSSGPVNIATTGSNIVFTPDSGPNQLFKL
jgi:hypothetical protein